MALIALTSMGCSKEDSVPAGGSPMTFTGVAPAASVPASAASSRSYFPGTSGLMYWSDFDNIGAYWQVARNNSRKAMKYYKKALKIDPDDYVAKKNISIIQLSQSKKGRSSK